jgi:Bacterial archaeo-eukaryotic release factor family 10
MITYGEVEKLHGSRAADQSVLSLYVYVPSDSVSARELQTRAVGLVEAATERTPETLHCEDELMARQSLAEHAWEWRGHTLGIFVSQQLGLLEVVPLPGRFAERAVLAGRPHLRPLLAGLERYPDHRIVVIDHRHAWLLTVAGERVEIVARMPAESSASSGFGGWYLEASHGLRRLTEFSPHFYQDAAAILDRQARHGGSQPLVVGGYADGVTQLLTLLPHAVLSEYAGSFAADPHQLTLARARDLAAPVVSHWAERREHQLVQAVTAPRPGMPTAIGLEACLTAVNAGTADLLLIADQPIVPGFHCERCDVLSVSSDECCDWGAASWPVPDLLEEMAWRTLHGGGQVVSARTLPCTVAARLQ